MNQRWKVRWRHRLISYRSDPGQTQADSISLFFKLYFLILMDVENILCFHGMARTRSQGWILFPVIICNTYWSDDQLPIIFNTLPAKYNITTTKCGLLMRRSQSKDCHSHQNPGDYIILGEIAFNIFELKENRLSHSQLICLIYINIDALFSSFPVCIDVLFSRYFPQQWKQLISPSL